MPISPIDLSDLLTSLFDDSLGRLIESLCEPPPAVDGEDEAVKALAQYVGRTNAYRAAFTLACSLLDGERSLKLVARLVELAREASSPDVPLDPHINEAKRQLLDDIAKVREAYGLFPR